MDMIKQGSSRERSVILLQAMLAEAGLQVSIDGRFGPRTDHALKSFQTAEGLVVDGIAGEKTWTTLFLQHPALLRRITSRYLQEDDIREAAGMLGVELAVMKTVSEVMSQGPGFIVDHPRIFFEGHVFWNELKKRGTDPMTKQRGNENILYPGPDGTGYSGGMEEYIRLEQAKSIDEEAALRSVSWGIYQLMGYEAEELGYHDVYEFADRMYKHEREHLRALIFFLEKKKLVHILHLKDWRAFVQALNGPGYEKKRTHVRLARAYEHYA
ncbi:N-acetylmuramidase family protein [Prosthecochloris sp. HL-130-GSB]|uniref:N-acetylmuramidase domain-containing protein n=1 Tax=Prosthecochloris sp. HL-130-GSB TaxID=1974213 RepID=UPI000A1C18ED|nr:N-acetylmuramidase family protein [Prosthecochloris sp. HL-130-GSB]ARM31474.1 hypothetical protein B9H02_09415 [Prosthecochloris sp. HL-130-GSB]